MAETSLYPAVKRFLETAGFSVKGEVDGCDVVAINLDLLLQAIDRCAQLTRYGWLFRRPDADVTEILACTVSAG